MLHLHIFLQDVDLDVLIFNCQCTESMYTSLCSSAGFVPVAPTRQAHKAPRVVQLQSFQLPCQSSNCSVSNCSARAHERAGQPVVWALRSGPTGLDRPARRVRPSRSAGVKSHLSTCRQPPNLLAMAWGSNAAATNPGPAACWIAARQAGPGMRSPGTAQQHVTSSRHPACTTARSAARPGSRALSAIARTAAVGPLAAPPRPPALLARRQSASAGGLAAGPPSSETLNRQNSSAPAAPALPRHHPVQVPARGRSGFARATQSSRAAIGARLRGYNILSHVATANRPSALRGDCAMCCVRDLAQRLSDSVRAAARSALGHMQQQQPWFCGPQLLQPEAEAHMTRNQCCRLHLVRIDSKTVLPASTRVAPFVPPHSPHYVTGIPALAAHSRFPGLELPG
jgi:hypothetical protein